MHTPVPPGRHAMRFRWLNLLFVHWPAPVERLRPLVPEGLEIDTFDGQAWVGLVPFTMRDVRHTGMPPIPTMHHFHECNVRTYVRHGADGGVWFFSLDAVSRLAVWGARTLWKLNYVHASIDLDARADVTHYAVRRRRTPNVTMRCAWRVGAPRPIAEDGSLEHFLTERYRLYTVLSRNRIASGRIWHEPWPLREATLLELEDHLVAAGGIDVSDAGPPHVMAADPIDVRAWSLKVG